MPRKRKAKSRHVCLSNGLCIHGAFTTKAKAEAKRAKLGRRAFVVRKLARWGRGPLSVRWMVAKLCPVCSGPRAHQRGKR